MTGAVEFVARFDAAEFETWKDAFHRQRAVRVRHGATGHRISRLVDDPHRFEVAIEFASLGGARGYADEVSRMDLHRELGVEGGPHHRRDFDEELREAVDVARYGFSAPPTVQTD
jgi:hypothetical protein